MSVIMYDSRDWGEILWWMMEGHRSHRTEEQRMDDAMALAVLADANFKAYINTYGANSAVFMETAGEIHGASVAVGAMAQKPLLKTVVDRVAGISYNCVSNDGADYLARATPRPSMRGRGQFPDWTGPDALIYVQKAFLRLAADHLR